MFNFKKIAKQLGLKDEGKAAFGDKVCSECGTDLRFGTDKNKYTWSYCPKCRKKIQTVLMPRFSPGIKIFNHKD